MMKRIITPILLTISLITSAYGQVISPELKILSRLNEENLDDYDSIQHVHAKPYRIAAIIGWVKLESNEFSGTSPKKLYLEWVFLDNSNTENILESGLMIGNKHLEFTWNPDKPTTFYWVTKRIWTDQIGKYKLKILKGPNQYLGETEVIVGE